MRQGHRIIMDNNFETKLLEAQRFMFRCAYKIVKDVHLADDVLQEANLRAWRGRDSILNVAVTKSWLCRIIFNVSFEFLKRRKPTQQLEEETIDETSSKDNLLRLGEAEGFSRLLDVIKALPKEMSQAITLKHILGENNVEGAKSAGCTPRTFEVRLVRARHELKKRLKRLMLLELFDVFVFPDRSLMGDCQCEINS